jgi:hypothetical protein
LPATPDPGTSFEVSVSIEEQHVALPKLYGAPAYARPVPMVDPTPRPFDRDELPLEAVMTDEERDIAEEIASRPYGSGPHQPQVQMAVQAGGPLRIGARPFRLSSITGRRKKGA